MASQAYVQSVLWFDHDEQAQFFRRLARALLFSFLAHLVILLLVTVLRLPQRGERSLLRRSKFRLSVCRLRLR